jgi:hypothetical protein
MKILYVGPTLPGSTSLQRLQAMRELGHTVVELRTTDFTEYHSLWSRVSLKLGYPLDLNNINSQISEIPDQEIFQAGLTRQ